MRYNRFECYEAIASGFHFLRVARKFNHRKLYPRIRKRAGQLRFRVESRRPVHILQCQHGQLNRFLLCHFRRNFSVPGCDAPVIFVDATSLHYCNRSFITNWHGYRLIHTGGGRSGQQKWVNGWSNCGYCRWSSSWCGITARSAHLLLHLHAAET